MATSVDVARRAGVSVSTVSHVVNGTRVVSPATTLLVEEAIAATGYRPNTIARALARSTTNSVGIAISAMSNPYFSDIIFAITGECARLGLMVFLSDTRDEPEQEIKVVQALHQRRVDGIILAPCADPDQKALTYLADNGIPTVLVDRMPSRNFDQVGVRNKHAVEELVSHLVWHGHRRIGMIAGQPGFTTTLERVEGFKAGIRKHELYFEPELLQAANPSVDAAKAATHKVLGLDRPPTALITGNNLATIGAMHAIRDAGLRVPADLALAGFDDFEWADCFEPRLTCLAQPCQELGRRAAVMLVERIKRPDAKKRVVRLRPSLIIRNSCGCP
jgi:LacI family transcriptional regulator